MSRIRTAALYGIGLTAGAMAAVTLNRLTAYTTLSRLSRIIVK